MRRQVLLPELLLYVFMFIFIGVICGFEIHCLINYIEDKLAVIIPFFLIWCFDAVFFFMSIYALIRYIKTRRVIMYGRKDVCSIIRYMSAGRRYSCRRCYMVVSYRGQNGQYYENKILCTFSHIDLYPSGSAIECKLYGNDCYVNPDFITIAKTKGGNYEL